MILLHKKSLIEVKEKVSNSILSWVRSHERFLNVVSLPYNSSDIFLEAIQDYIKNGKSVIYITNEDPSNINILETVKKYTNFRDYTYVRNERTNLKSKLKVSSFNNALLINEKFDLVIYDDIRSFPVHSKYEILDLIAKVSKGDSKFISYSVESILKGGREINLPVKDSRNPIIEPRTILTRININKDIPFVVYEYLKWSIDCGRRVVICVPDEKRIENVYLYINNYCHSLSNNIVCIPKGKITRRIISNFEKIKRAVLITNDFEQVFSSTNDSDVMVYFANNPEFSYKKLIYFCGSVGRGEKDWKGEVIFLSNEETEDMEKAKNITRNFNKEAWEMGLLKI